MQLTHNQLEAIRLAAAINSTRSQLNGVYFDPAGYIVATDNHRLHRLQTQEFKGDGFILDNDDIKVILASVKAAIKTSGKLMRDDYKMDMRMEGEEIVSTLSLLDNVVTSYKCKPIDATFPDYNRYIPSDMSLGRATSEISFNAAYMVDFQKAAKLLTNTRAQQIKLDLMGNMGPIKVSIAGCTEFSGVLMSMRF